jgi:hypothetical protein
VVNDGIVLHVINHDEIVIGVNSVEGLRAAWKIYCYHGQEFCSAVRENNYDRFVSRKKGCLKS